MKPRGLMWILLFLWPGAVFQVPAQPATTGTGTIAEIRAKAEKGDASSQCSLGLCYSLGQGVSKDTAEAAKWFRKAAEQGNASAQYVLGRSYAEGAGVAKDQAEAVKWFRKAAEQGDASAQCSLGLHFIKGEGVAKDAAEAVKWHHKAAEQGNARAQFALGVCYANGEGVAKDYVAAYKWINLALAQGDELAKQHLPTLEDRMTAEQIAEAQRLTREFKPSKTPELDEAVAPERVIVSPPSATGTGFFITEDGFLITNEHLIEGAAQVRLVTRTAIMVAQLVKTDAATDLSLLKAEGRFAPLPVATSRNVRLGNSVATVGFPNIDLQGFSPKLAKGEIAGLSGAQDDPKLFQISVPVQPGNSGGALVDERGNVVGVVTAKLNAAAAMTTSGTLPENVNYAVKSSFLLSFLESVPDVAAKLKEPNTKDRQFEDVVQSAEQAAVLVLVY